MPGCEPVSPPDSAFHSSSLLLLHFSPFLHYFTPGGVCVWRRRRRRASPRRFLLQRYPALACSCSLRFLLITSFFFTDHCFFFLREGFVHFIVFLWIDIFFRIVSFLIIIGFGSLRSLFRLCFQTDLETHKHDLTTSRCFEKGAVLFTPNLSFRI